MNNIEKYLELPHRETITSYNTLTTKSFDYQKTENMSNKKQTAVEWLAQQFYEKMDMKGDGRAFDEIIEQAKEMERQQILDAHIEGQPFATCISQKAEEYYKKTYFFI